MASRLEYPGLRWSIFFGGGLSLWIFGVSFARFVPPSIQFCLLAVPIGLQCTALTYLPGWRREGKKSDLMDSLAEREFVAGVQHQHLLNLASLELDYRYQVEALESLNPLSDRHPEDSRSLPIASEQISLEQEVRQMAGETGVELYQYLTSGRGAQMGDAGGWVRVDRLRAGWGKTRNLKTEAIREMLNLLGRLVLIEWKDGRMMEFRMVP